MYRTWSLTLGEIEQQGTCLQLDFRGKRAAGDMNAELERWSETF